MNIFMHVSFQFCQNTSWRIQSQEGKSLDRRVGIAPGFLFQLSGLPSARRGAFWNVHNLKSSQPSLSAPQSCPMYSWCLSYCLLCGDQLLFALWVPCTMVSKQCRLVLGNRLSWCGTGSELQQLRVHSNYLWGVPGSGTKEQMRLFLWAHTLQNFPTALTREPQCSDAGSPGPLSTVCQVLPQTRHSYCPQRAHPPSARDKWVKK